MLAVGEVGDSTIEQNVIVLIVNAASGIPRGLPS